MQNNASFLGNIRVALILAPEYIDSGKKFLELAKTRYCFKFVHLLKEFEQDLWQR